MNAILVHLVECGLRVSLVAAATLGCLAIAGRRRPAARAAFSTTGLVSILWLTLLAGVPSPTWCIFNPADVGQGAEPSASGTQESLADGGPAGFHGDGGGVGGAAAGGAQLDVLAAARRLAGARPPSEASSAVHWPLVVLVLLAAGATLGVVRLGWSLTTALRIGRESHAVPDAELHALLAKTARSLRCTRPISLRESAELTSAAAVGWPKATIVLPIAWREWSGEELSGVLAHEVAHVVRRDFLTRCLALLVGAVHFYHPLVRWLTRQVVLNQELSADELATRAAGGQTAYLHALSRLALREDDRSRSGSIAGVLPVFSGFLIRRIEMLQTTERIGCAAPWRGLRRAAGSLLVVLSIALAGVRGTAAPPPADETPETSRVPTGGTADAASDTTANGSGPADSGTAFRRAAIDPSAVVLAGKEPVAQGAFVIRVAELWKRPGFARTFREITAPGLADDVNAGNWIWKDLFGSAEAPDIGLEDVDYILGNLHLTLTPIGDLPVGSSDTTVEHAGETRRLMFGANLVHIRLRKPLDWPQLARCLPKATPDRHQDVTFLKLLVPEIGPVPICLFAADDRTLAICSGDIVHGVIDQRSNKPAAPAWIEHWKAADGGLITFLSPAPLAAYDTALRDLETLYLGGVFDADEKAGAETDDSARLETDRSAGNQVATDDGFHSRLLAMVSDSPYVAGGIDWAGAETMRLKLHLACGTKTVPRQARDDLERLITLSRRAALDAKELVDVRLVEFLNSLSVTVSDDSRESARGVIITGAARLRLETLLFGDDDGRAASPAAGDQDPTPPPASNAAEPVNGELDASEGEQRQEGK